MRTDDLDAVAARLRIPVGEGSRRAHDGRLLRWRYAGVEQAVAEPALPFFIEWAPDARFPGRAGAFREGFEIAELHVEGDADRLATWLGKAQLPVTVDEGKPVLRRVVLTGPEGEVVLRA